MRVPSFPAACLAVLLVAAVGSPFPAHAESDRAPDARTPIEEFSQQLETFKKTIPELNKKIENSASSIDALTDVAKTRAELEELRAVIAAALGAVSDNGDLARLGNKALAHAGEKLKALSQDRRFRPEERQFLYDQWVRLRDDTARAVEELSGARAEFAELLRTLQVSEDFVDELIQIRQATKALDVIRHLTREIREASEQLKKLIGAIKAPGV